MEEASSPAQQAAIAIAMKKDGKKPKDMQEAPVGGGTSITLTNSVGALDLLTFIVSYNGATSIANTSFTVVGFAATDFRNAIV